jgi:hypothetical protein
VVDGRLHYYKGELVETPPDQPTDFVAMQTMVERLGVSIEDLVTSDGDLTDGYVMCDYTGDKSRLRIAVKETPSIPSETAQAEARERIGEWASANGVELDWVPYGSLLAGE